MSAITGEIKEDLKDLLQNASVDSVSSVATVRASNPEDVFATMFYMYMPLVKNVLPQLSKKQLKRILSAVIEVPLNDKPYKILDDNERKIYNIIDGLLIAKYAMIMGVLVEKQTEKELEKNEKTEKIPPEKV